MSELASGSDPEEFAPGVIAGGERSMSELASGSDPEEFAPGVIAGGERS